MLLYFNKKYKVKFFHLIMELNENAKMAIIMLIIVWYIGMFLLLIFNHNCIIELENKCIAFFNCNSNEEENAV